MNDIRIFLYSSADIHTLQKGKIHNIRERKHTHLLKCPQASEIAAPSQLDIFVQGERIFLNFWTFNATSLSSVQKGVSPRPEMAISA